MKQKFLDFLADKDIFYIFVYKLSVRRHFIPILSIFYLTIPDTTLNQIGIFTGIGYLLGMIFEMPSGYISDNIGHKKTLMLSRFSMILSLVFFILGGTIFIENPFILFILGTVFMNIGFSFNSGTIDAFFYEILEVRGEKDKFTKINSRMGGTVSLVAVFFLVLLPLTLQIHNLAPFVFNIIFDVIGIFALLKLPNPRDNKKLITGETQGLFSMVKDSISLGILPFVMFSGIIGGLLLAKNGFDTVYLESLGLLPIYVGFLMGLSRLFRFILSRNIHVLEEKFNMKQILIMQIFIYSLGLILVSYFQNYFFILIILAFLGGFIHAIGSINLKFLFENYLKNPKYKATIGSLKEFTGLFIGALLTIIIAPIMQQSYQTGYLVLGVLMFIGLSISYLFFVKKISTLK